MFYVTVEWNHLPIGEQHQLFGFVAAATNSTV